MLNKPYFNEREAHHPEPLRRTVTQRVRFEEVDMLGIVWHGRYPSYFEDARTRLGEAYGVGYMDFYSNRVVAPIKKMHIDYHRPITFDEEIRIEAVLHWSDAVRLNHEYVIRNQAGQLATTGYTIQLMLDMDQNVLMVPPPFYLEFREKWQAGELT